MAKIGQQSIYEAERGGRIEAQAEEYRRHDALRAELLEHESQFITIAEIGRILAESGIEGYTGNLWQAIHGELKGCPEAVIFCRWAGYDRWVPLPDQAVTPVVVGARNRVESAAKFNRAPMGDPIGHFVQPGNPYSFVPSGNNAAFAVRRELAERLFDLEAFIAATEARKAPTPAPSASAPTVAAPEAVARPPQQQRHQEGEILRVLRKLGYNPTATPRNKPGMAGPKAEARKCLNFSMGVFDAAWERLRADGRIADA